MDANGRLAGMVAFWLAFALASLVFIMIRYHLPLERVGFSQLGGWPTGLMSLHFHAKHAGGLLYSKLLFLYWTGLDWAERCWCSLCTYLFTRFTALIKMVGGCSGLSLGLGLDLGFGWVRWAATLV